MSAIILVSQAYDRALARPVVDALYAAGVSFFWEHDGGSTAALADARCAVLLWSRRSSQDSEMIRFAERARGAGKAIDVRIEAGAQPPGVGVSLHDLGAFEGGRASINLTELEETIRAKAQGIEPPPVRSLIARIRRHSALVWVGVVTPLLIAIGYLVDILEFSGLFDGPSREEKEALARVEPGSCMSLQKFHSRFQDGHYAERVARVLAAPEIVETSVPASQIYPLDLVVTRSDGAGQPSEAAAWQDAEKRAAAQVAHHCQRLITRDGERVADREYEVVPSSRDCSGRLSDGFRCGFVASVKCTIAWSEIQPVARCDFKP